MRTLITGAGGQLGRALQAVFPGALAADRSIWDVTASPPTDLGAIDLVLHAAAWTDVDGAERDPELARRVNVLGTRAVAALGAPVVAFSTDYVFAGDAQRPYTESDLPAPRSSYGRTKLEAEGEVGRGWVVRTSWLFGPTGTNFVRTMLRLGRERDEVAVVDDQVGCPTFVGDLASAVPALLTLPHGVWHVAASGQCSWAEFAEAIFEDAGLGCKVRRISTQELGRPAPRPHYSVLRSERPGAPVLPHWRAGLQACLVALGER